MNHIKPFAENVGKKGLSVMNEENETNFGTIVIPSLTPLTDEVVEMLRNNQPMITSDEINDWIDTYTYNYEWEVITKNEEEDNRYWLTHDFDV